MRIYNEVLDWLVRKMVDETNKKFLSNIDQKDGECWTWKLCFNTGGYGSFRRASGATEQAHVYSYALHNNKLSKYGKPQVSGLILHKCGNRKCCNPKHLYEGSYKDNARDSIEHGTFVSATVKLSYSDIIKLQQSGASQVDIAKVANVTQSGISRFISRNKKEVGYV